jgi:hypothetical protein
MAEDWFRLNDALHYPKLARGCWIQIRLPGLVDLLWDEMTGDYDDDDD